MPTLEKVGVTFYLYPADLAHVDRIISRPWGHDPSEVELRCNVSRVAVDDGDAVARDALRPLGRRELGRILHQQNYREARERIVSLLNYATPPPPDGEPEPGATRQGWRRRAHALRQAMGGAFPLARGDPLTSRPAPPTRSPPTGNGAAGFVFPCSPVHVCWYRC